MTKKSLFCLLVCLFVCFAFAPSGFGQVKPFTGGPNNNGTGAVFFAVDGTQTPISAIGALPNTDFTVRAFIDLSGISGSDGNGNNISVMLSGMQLAITYDPTVIQLESPNITASSCTDSLRNPIFQNATGVFSTCGSYTFGLDANGNFSPNVNGQISLQTSSTSLPAPSGLVTLPAFKFKLQSAEYKATVINIALSGPQFTAFSAGLYTSTDIGIGFTATNLTVIRPPTAGSGTVSIGGTEQVISGIHTFYDFGTVNITVNGYTATASYGSTSTSTSVATSLLNTLNTDSNSPVTATLSGTTLTLTSKQPGAGSNYSLSTSTTYDTGHFASCSFSATPSGSALVGGGG